MDNNFSYRFIEPEKSLAEFVENIGMFHNPSDEAKELVVIPDGRIDLFFSQSLSEPFHVMLMGLETEPEQRSLPPQTLTFSISFKPLAVEYFLPITIAGFLNSSQELPDDFWGFNSDDLKDFDGFYKKATKKLKTLLPGKIDERKATTFRAGLFIPR